MKMILTIVTVIALIFGEPANGEEISQVEKTTGSDSNLPICQETRWGASGYKFDALTTVGWDMDLTEHGLHREMELRHTILHDHMANYSRNRDKLWDILMDDLEARGWDTPDAKRYLECFKKIFGPPAWTKYKKQFKDLYEDPPPVLKTYIDMKTKEYGDFDKYVDDRRKQMEEKKKSSKPVQWEDDSDVHDAVVKLQHAVYFNEREIVYKRTLPKIPPGADTVEAYAKPLNVSFIPANANGAKKKSQVKEARRKLKAEVAEKARAEEHEETEETEERGVRAKETEKGKVVYAIDRENEEVVARAKEDEKAVEMERGVRAKETETVEVEYDAYRENVENVVATSDDAKEDVEVHGSPNNVTSADATANTGRTKDATDSFCLVKFSILFIAIIEVNVAIIILVPHRNEVSQWFRRTKMAKAAPDFGEKEPLCRGEKSPYHRRLQQDLSVWKPVHTSISTDGCMSGIP